MIPDKNIMCPYTGFAKSCREGVVEHCCPKWVHVMGANPQTGDHVDKYACSDSLIPMLLIENSQMQRQTGAAVETFRNEMVRMNHMSLVMMGDQPHAQIKGPQ
jgi:hypothetical protein